MALEAYQLIVVGPMPAATKGGINPVKARLTTTETAAAVETAGYFNSAAGRLPKGSRIEATMVLAGTPIGKSYIVTANTGSAVTVAVQTTTAG